MSSAGHYGDFGSAPSPADKKWSGATQQKNQDDDGWVVQEKNSPNGRWRTIWITAHKTKGGAIKEWRGASAFDEWRAWGRARCVRCRVVGVE